MTDPLTRAPSYGHEAVAVDGGGVARHAPLRITRAALPTMRARGSGHIVQISSVGGLTANADVGAYHASKWALEAISESLSRELAGSGVSVTLFEPGGFDTDWAGSSLTRSVASPATRARRAAAAASTGSPRAKGGVAAAAAVLLEVVEAASLRCGSWWASTHWPTWRPRTPPASRRGGCGRARGAGDRTPSRVGGVVQNDGSRPQVR